MKYIIRLTHGEIEEINSVIGWANDQDHGYYTGIEEHCKKRRNSIKLKLDEAIYPRVSFKIKKTKEI